MSDNKSEQRKLYPKTRQGDGKSKTTYGPLSDEQAIEMGFQKKVKEQENKREPAKKFKAGGSVNTRRENRLEELGRVDAEKAYTKKGKRNLKAEKKRIVREVSSRGAAKRGHGKEIK